jgi:competence protein ComEC
MPGENDSTNDAPVQHPALWIAGAVCGGIAADRWLDLWIFSYCTIAVISAVAIVGYRCGVAGPHSKTRQLCATLLLFASLGSCWHHAYWNFYPANEISRWATEDSRPVCISARLLSEPRRIATASAQDHLNRPRDQSDQYRVLIRCLGIRAGDQWQPTGGRALLTAPVSDVPIHAGDQVTILGRLKRIASPSNPGAFDFRNHYRRHRIRSSLYCSHADSVEVTKRSETVPWLASLRTRLNDLAWHHLAPRQASLASAILLGNREQLEPARREVFLQTGTIHLLAISGLHVGILACCFFALFRCGWLSRNACLFLTTGFVVFYAWLVEFRPPVVRASILIVLFCAARMLGRSGLSYNVLALAALLVLIINPTDLFALGTQLSFLAVAAIQFGNRWIFHPPADPLQQLIQSTRPWPVRAYQAALQNLRAAFVVSGLIWLISIPLVAISFHVLAPVGLVVNPLVLLPIAVSLYAGITIFVFGDIAAWVAQLAAVVCTFSLGFIEAFAGWASKIPYGHLWTAGPPVISVAIFYLGWLIFGLFPPTRVSVRRLCGLAAMWLILGWCVPVIATHFYRSQIQQSLTTTFVDVGHGTAVLIELPGGKVVLYDCGSTASSKFAARCVSDVLWHKGIGAIDSVIVSHADIDHFNGIPELSKRFSIGTIYLSPMMNRHESPSVAELKQALLEGKIDVKEIAAGNEVEIDRGVRIEAIAPATDSVHPNDNSASIVLSVQYQGRRILLPGDLEKEGLEVLLATPATHFDLIMAAHHGSPHSDPHRFCEWATPRCLAVSCGTGKFSPVIADAAAGLNCQLLRTDTDGAITFEIRRDGSTSFRPFLQ